MFINPFKKGPVLTESKIVSHQTLTLDSGQISYKLIRSRIARHLRLKISLEKGLEVVIPVRFNLSEVPGFIHKKQDWIFKNLKKMSVIASEQKNKKKNFEDGIAISIMGATKNIHIISQPKFSRPRIQSTETELFIFCDGTTFAAKKKLVNYLKMLIKYHIIQRTKELSHLMGTHHNRITIRSQKTRWGSCSHRNNLNFNWRLIFMPPAVIDYIIIHELAHTVHHNHSKRFYGLVEKFCPDYKHLKKLLRQNQQTPI